MLGGVDRTLGMAFGVLRGLALVVFAYIAAGLVVSADKWPDPVVQARAMPYAFEGAQWAVAFLPPNYRPVVSAPPGGKTTRAEDVMKVAPQGRALTSRP